MWRRVAAKDAHVQRDVHLTEREGEKDGCGVQMEEKM